MSKRYQKSEALLKRALKTIPLGSQTFSKSKTQYPWGVSPFFINKAKGSHVWDIDGNEYIDFINSLAAITLGYNDPDVNRAVSAQLKKGVIFSLPDPIELEVAELIKAMVPCAEMVRFGKNGSDATAGAVRVARAYTKRDYIAVCGYHGWQDWYIGSTPRNLGVPKSTQQMTHKFLYNDLESLHSIFKKYPGQVAAVIMEPMGAEAPKPGYLEEVRRLSHKNGALLIFDETITGFRISNGGAQKWLGIVPDLATFGKGVANGYPLSVVAGAAKYMRLMEEIFFSFTFGGETLSLAAAKATLTKLRSKPILKQVQSRGLVLKSGVEALIRRWKLENILSISGHPAWTILTFSDRKPYTAWDIKTFFLQENFARGILVLASHNISYAHSDRDIQCLLSVYDDVFKGLSEVISKKTLYSRLHCKPLQPLFKVR